MKERMLSPAQAISARQAAEWRRRAVPSRYKRGQVLFYRDHFPYGFWIILSGRADLRMKGRDPKSSVSVGPNQVLGFSWLLSGEPYPATAVVTDDMETSFIEKTLAEAWMKKKDLLLDSLKP